MKKIYFIFALVAFAFIACDRNDVLDNGLTRKNDATAITEDANRNPWQVVLGKQLANPYSVENMRAALDTLKAHPDQQSTCMKAPGETLEEISIQPTDLYVRFLPADSMQYVKLMTDSTLILFDYPLDYQKEQTGDYYKDPTVKGVFTWLYASVPIGYQPPSGIQYEIIKELFIPEHSPYYSQEAAPSNVKGIKRVKTYAAKQKNYADVLKRLEAVSFIITGNGNQLDKPTTGTTPTGMQKATSYVTKRFLWCSWREAVYNPEGYIKVSTPVGDQPLANIRVRVARWFTAYETRTNADGKFYFYNQFGQDAIFPNIEYFVIFDGYNGNNSWQLCNGFLGAVTSTSIGVHSPDNYSMTFDTYSYYWGECVGHKAINDYINIARNEGLSLPPAKLNISIEKGIDYIPVFPSFVNNLNYGLFTSLFDYIDVRFESHFTKNFDKAMAFAWHELIHASQVNRMITLKGSNWASDYWVAIKNQMDTDNSDGLNDCFSITHKQEGDCSQQIALTEGWANFREEALMKQYFGRTNYTETTNPYLIQYISMFRDLQAIGCSTSCLERSLCANSLAEFRNNLTSYYPYLSQQISNIVPNPDREPGTLTLMTYNLKVDDPGGLYGYQSYRIAKQARLIASSNADVVSIQEIHMENFNKLKLKSGLNGEMVSLNPNGSGVGLLWNPTLGLPGIQSKTFGSTSPGGENRALIFAEFNNFCFIATHYGADENQNTNMSNAVIAYAKSVNKPVYIAGDLNEEPGSPTIKSLTDNSFVVLDDQNIKTSPSYNPVTLIDLILGYKNNSTEPNIISRGVPVLPNKSFIDASDHLPYCVRVKL